MTKKYKKIYVAFDTEHHAKAIEILENVPRYWRNDFISDAITAYNNKRDELVSKKEKSQRSKSIYWIECKYYNKRSEIMEKENEKNLIGLTIIWFCLSITIRASTRSWKVISDARMAIITGIPVLKRSRERKRLSRYPFASVISRKPKKCCFGP